ncbi:MAG TPA: copper resistance protein CopC [Jatrophihabitans sp.]|jgi:copper transport protein|uniref:copper resistance CopC/CopD family protein n=1 Tax=Jatrophihabitans sp. TaxID=1932789 RepID=UPI002DFAB01E|nr:copper resistance protein CopC [Jatrophihabitans sp.]
MSVARRLAAVVGGLVALLATALLLAAPASAHATVVTSDPIDGSRLKAAPRSVTIVFDESVGIGGVGYLHVTDGNGRRVDGGEAFHPDGDSTKVTDTLRSGLGDSTYTASFRVVSADSHPVAGTIRFVVGTGPLARGNVTGTSADASTGDVFDVARWISFAGLALLGGAWIVFTVWPCGRDEPRARRLLWLGWGGATLGTALEVLLQGPYTAGESPFGVGKIALLDSTLHSDYGLLHSLRLVLLGIVALVFARSLADGVRPARWEGVLALVAGALVWTFSAAGHAGTTAPKGISVPLDALHLLAMAAWIGALVMVAGALLPRRDADEIRAVMPLVSRVAFAAVCTLAITGTYAAWRGIGTVDAILTTDYGRLVVAKVVLFFGLLALGNLSRTLVRRRTVAYALDDTALAEAPVPADELVVERLRRSVLVEAGIGVIVLALTAVLVAQPRGKESLAAQYRRPVSATTSLGGGRSLAVTADPGTHGTVNLTVDVAGGPSPSRLTATATQSAAQIGPLPLLLTRESDGVYDASIALPVAGAWRIDLVVTTSAFDAVTADVTLHLH